jgi:hypothetical protein
MRSNMLDPQPASSSSGGYISAADIPSRATGFWNPSEPLHLDTDDRDRSGYYDRVNRHLSYVGTDEEIEVIEAGRLARGFARPMVEAS